MSKNLKKDLQVINREIKALSKKVEKVIIAVEKLEKAKAVKAKPVRKAAVKKPVAKAKPVRKAAVKKPAVKAKPVRKAAVKKPAAKKTAQLSAVDTAFGFIKRYKKGISTAALMEKTGFDQKKVYNIIYKLNSLGKIKSVGKGVYVKA
jgi:membrane protein involved in colicin uptake